MIKRLQSMALKLGVRFQGPAQRKRAAYGLAAVALVLVAVAIYLMARPATPANGVRVRRGRITASVEASGKVRASREAWLSLRSGAVVRSVLVKPGQRVERGDVLVQADIREAEQQVREAEINLQIRQIQFENTRGAPSATQIEIARAGLRRAVAVLQAAQTAYDRVEAQGRAKGSAEAVALESAKLDWETARAQFEQAVRGPSADQIQIAEKGLELARLALQAARNRLEHSTITAPFDGTVVQVNVREGEVAFGEKVIRLADLSTLEVVAHVDELDVGELVPGQQTEIRLDAFPGQALEGRVARITPGATPLRGTVSYETLITFAPGQLAVRPDMTAYLHITTLSREDTLLVPARAVETRGRNKYVRVLEGGRLHDVRVTTGLSDDMDTEILEGLREGQQVVVR